MVKCRFSKLIDPRTRYDSASGSQSQSGIENQPDVRKCAILKHLKFLPRIFPRETHFQTSSFALIIGEQNLTVASRKNGTRTTLHKAAFTSKLKMKKKGNQTFSRIVTPEFVPTTSATWKISRRTQVPSALTRIRQQRERHARQEFSPRDSRASDEKSTGR